MMSLRGRIIAASATVILPLSLAVPAHAEQPIPLAVPEGSVSLGTVLASGEVRDANDNAISGAEVVAVVWPDANTLKGLREGEGFTPQLVDQVRTDTNGRYVLSTDKLPRDKKAPITVEFVAVTDTETASWFTTIDTRGGFKASVAEVNSPDLTSAVSVARSGDRASGLQLDFTADGKGSSAKAMDVIAPAAVPGRCYLNQNLGSRSVIVGQTYSAVSGGHTRKFTYTSSATSTLGVGASATGGAGTWTASGTTTASSTATVGFPAHSDATGRILRTNFTFGKFRCAYGVTPTWGYRVYPTGFAGGATVGTVALPTANYCVSHAAGSTFSKSSTAAVSWSNGVSLSTAIGINLSAKTGYSTQSKLDYTFSSARRLCGQNAYPAGTPFTIVVKA